MKNRLLAGLAVVIAAGILAPSTARSQQVQATPAKPKAMKEMGEDHAMSGWKELDAFHAIMAATWHPAAQSNDLKPIRAKADSLAGAADKWAASKVPAPCDTKSIRDAITAVASQSKDVAALAAKQAPDAELKAALRNVHMRFEVVEHGCHPDKKG